MEEEEKFLNSKEELIGELRTLLGGRAAEDVVFGTQTTGAANDIERATDLARKMITMFGMSKKFGLMALATTESQYLGGQSAMNCAESTAAEADAEVRELLSTCYQEACQMLRDNREHLDEIALFLLTKETITGDEFMSFLKEPEELPASEEVQTQDAEQSAEQTAQGCSTVPTEESPEGTSSPEHMPEEPSEPNE